MVLKGARARAMKKQKLKGRPERSLYVTFKYNRAERDRVVEILDNAHPDIERVFLPDRHQPPKFVYVLCKGVDERGPVKKALINLKNEELGHINVSKPKPLKPEVKSPLTSAPKEVDRKTLLLEWIPAELETEEIEKAFPEAKKVDRFNKRRCYVHFRKGKDAMKARVRVAKEEIGGHKIKVKFNKVQKAGESESAEKESSDKDDDEDHDSESE